MGKSDPNDKPSYQGEERRGENRTEKTEDQSTDTIINASAQLSYEIVHEAKDQANELFHLPQMVLRFLKNPMAFIRQTPDLKTPTWVVLAVSSGILGAILSASLHQSWLRLIVALLILPTGSFLSVFATTSILKIVIRGANGLKFRYRSGASIFAFSNLFWWVPIGAMDKVPGISIVGFLVAIFIAAHGFIHKLALPRPVVLTWFAALTVAHLALWLLGRLVS